MNANAIALLLGALSLAVPAVASETVTYTYDALGRMVHSSTAGGPNSGKSVGTTLDPAGNRCAHGPGATGGLGNCGGAGSGGGSGGGGGPNQAPVAVDDSGTMTRCANKAFHVLANDSDPDGHLPLELSTVSSGAPRGEATVSGTSILFTPNGSTGAVSVTYTMRDSLGASDSATLSINVIVGDCGPIQ